MAFTIMAKIGADISSFELVGSHMDALNEKLQNLNEIQIKIDQFRATYANITGMEQKLAQAQARAQGLALAIGQSGEPSKEMEGQFSAARAEVQKLKADLLVQKAAAQGLRDQLSAAGVSTRTLAADQRKLSKDMAAVSAKRAKAEQIQARYEKARALQEKVTKARDQSKMAMNKAQATLNKAAAPVKIAMSFETEMFDLAQYVPGALDASGQMAKVYEQAQRRVLQASKDMMIMPDSMAQAFTMAAKFGVQGVSNLDQFARMGIAMGTAFDAPADRIVGQFAQIGAAMGFDLTTGPGITQLQALGDAVNFLDDQSSASGAAIIDVLQRTGAAAAALVPTLSGSALAGMAAALLQMGASGETAAASLNTLLDRAADAPAQSQGFRSALSEVGFAPEQLQSGMQQDAGGTMAALFNRIGELDAAKQGNVLGELFGGENLAGLSQITEDYGEFLRLVKLGNSGAGQGSMLKEFDAQSQSAARQLEGLKAATTRMAISFGSLLLPDIKSLTKALSGAADWFTSLGEKNKGISTGLVRLVAGVLGASAALKTLSWAGWTVIKPFADFHAWSKKVELGQKLQTASTKLATGAQWLLNTTLTAGKTALIAVQGWFQKLNLAQRMNAIITKLITGAQWLWNAALAATPIGLIVAGIVSLISAGYFLIKNWNQISAAFTAIWNNPRAALQAFMDLLTGKIPVLKNIGKLIAAIFGGSQNKEPDPTISPQIPNHATGGIFNQPHVAWFAENGPEAAIPLDGSDRSRSLWTQAGTMLGAGPGGTSGPGGGDTFVFSPKVYVNGNDPGAEQKVQRVVRLEADDFERRMTAWRRQQRRVSFA